MGHLDRLADPNPLARGFYTVPEAARLIEVGSTHRIYGWLKGYRNRAAGPLLIRDYAPINNKQELSFIDLIEIRFVEHFREHGVKMPALRRAAEELRKEFGTDHPFATSRVHLVTDRADVFLEIMRESAEETRDRTLLSLTTKNFMMAEIIERFLVPGIVFNKRDYMPRRWTPRHERFPEIVVDPRVAYGQPVGPSGVPTATIMDSYVAESENLDEVALWLGIPVAEAARAVNFENCLDYRLQANAA
jgi:hypothetical protein